MTDSDAAPVDASGSEAAPPLLRIVRGTPTPEELAALLAVVTARGSSGAGAPEPPRSRWNAPDRLVRRIAAPGPGAWRASALP